MEAETRPRRRKRESLFSKMEALCDATCKLMASSSVDDYAERIAKMEEVQRDMARQSVTAAKTAQMLREAHYALHKVIGSPLKEILADPKVKASTHDDFVKRLYDAMTHISIRKWARQHRKLLAECANDLKDINRKIGKLNDRMDGDEPEAQTAVALRTRLYQSREEKMVRMSLVLRKFLEIRECVLLTVAGTTEMIYKAMAGEAPADLIREFPADYAVEQILDADRRASRGQAMRSFGTRKPRRGKGR